MPSHPLALAVKARDLDAMIDTLAPDVVFRSPLISAPFEGREQVGDLFRVLAETFLFEDDTRYMEEVASGDRVVLFFEAKLKGRQVHGADLLRLDDQGKIREMTVSLGPWQARPCSPRRSPLESPAGAAEQDREWSSSEPGRWRR